MSVRTRVDEARDEAIKHIEGAISNILEILEPNTWTHGDLADSYLDTLSDELAYLLKLKRKL